MKNTGRIFLAVVLACGIFTARGQAIDMASYLDEATIKQLGEANATALKNKVSRIITRNGMTDAAGLFVVTPTLSITDEDTVDTGMTSMRVVEADLTLAVKNIRDGIVFGSQTVSLRVQANSDQAALRSLIDKVNVNDVRFAKLIKDAQGSIAGYYARRMPAIITKVNSLADRGEWEDAMVVLAVIPENVAEYETVARMQVDIYNRMMDGRQNTGSQPGESGAESGVIPGDIAATARAEAKKLKDKRAEDLLNTGSSLDQWIMELLP